MICFDESYLTIHKQEDARCVTMEWKMFAKGEKFRDGLKKGLDVLVESRYRNWLADLRRMRIIMPEDQEWSNTEWFPQALKAGIEKMAIVVSGDVFNRMAVDSIMSKVQDTDLTVQYFENKEDAVRWLKD